MKTLLHFSAVVLLICLSCVSFAQSNIGTPLIPNSSNSPYFYTRKALGDRIIELKGLVKQKNKKIKRLNGQIGNLRKRLDRKPTLSEIVLLKDEIKTLENQLAVERQEKEELQGVVDGLNRTIDRLRNQLTEAESEYYKQDTAYITLEAKYKEGLVDIDSLNYALKRSEEARERLVKTQKIAKELSRELEEERDYLKKNNDRHKLVIAGLEKKNEKAQEKVEEVEQEMEKMKKQQEDLYAEIDSINKVADLKGKYMGEKCSQVMVEVKKDKVNMDVASFDNWKPKWYTKEKAVKVTSCFESKERLGKVIEPNFIILNQDSTRYGREYKLILRLRQDQSVEGRYYVYEGTTAFKIKDPLDKQKKYFYQIKYNGILLALGTLKRAKNNEDDRLEELKKRSKEFPGDPITALDSSVNCYNYVQIHTGKGEYVVSSKVSDVKHFKGKIPMCICQKSDVNLGLSAQVKVAIFEKGKEDKPILTQEMTLQRVGYEDETYYYKCSKKEKEYCILNVNKKKLSPEKEYIYTVTYVGAEKFFARKVFKKGGTNDTNESMYSKPE